MSEAQKVQRAIYLKNRKKIINILSAVVLALTILTAAFSIIFVVRDVDTYVEFYEDGSALYHAYLNENEYYEEERLNGNHAYVASLIHHMDASFTYKVQMDTEKVTYKYRYRVDAQLFIIDKDTGAAIYNPVETIMGPTDSTFSGKMLFINPTVDIDYIYYNEKASKFISDFNLRDVSSYLAVTMFVDVVGMSENFANDNAGQYTVQVKVPLVQDVLKPTVTSTIPTGPQKVLANPTRNNVVFKILAIIFGCLLGGALIATAIYILKTRNEHIDYTRKVAKLVSRYKAFIQKINNPFDTTGYQVLLVNTFNEMLEIRDTLQVPILMNENGDKTRTVFMIPTTSNLLYTFDIKVDNYEMFYGENGSVQI